jgi:LysR family glycine cleavage system transcriptional activator
LADVARCQDVRHIDGNSGIQVEFCAAYQAAIDGLIAIAQRSFVEEDFKSGRLVAPFDLDVPGDGAYYLSYATDRAKGESVAAFEAVDTREAALTNEWCSTTLIPARGRKSATGWQQVRDEPHHGGAHCGDDLGERVGIRW